MNYHTSFHPSMQNDNGCTMSGHQVVCCVPQIDCRGAVKRFRTCQVRICLCFNVFGRCVMGESTSKQYFLLSTVQSVLLKVLRVHRLGWDSKQRCRKTMLLRKQEAQLWGAEESHFTRSRSERQRRAGFLMQ